MISKLDPSEASLLYVVPIAVMSKRSREESDLSREERKAQKKLKKSRKGALSVADITPSESEVASPTPIEPAPVEDQDEGGSYTQYPELSKVPQQEVDVFFSENLVQIKDGQDLKLRPVLNFSHLPTDILQQYGSLFKTFEKPSAVQSATWPFLLSKRDAVGVAETGSGKTLAFGLPLVVRLASLKKLKSVRAVVIAPTRELAIQVFEQIQAIAAISTVDVKTVCVYGGTSKDDQRRTLKGANIIVGTPGRMKDFMNDGSIDVSKVKYLVLDEADRMLDKGFEDDIKQIVGQMPSSKKRQTAMFTATWPQSIRNLAATFMTDPVKVTIGRDADGDDGHLRANTRITQSVEVMDGYDKQNRLIQLLAENQKGAKKQDKILVFCLYKKEATRIEELIKRRGFSVAGIHGDMNQSARIQSLEAFKKGRVTVLVATDVAARGLDIPSVKLVINVTFPLTAEDYVHRIGRTGRAGAEGRSITFFTEQDKGLAGGLINVLKTAKQEVPEALMKFGTTVKKKAHDSYGAFYKDTEDMKPATKITFDD